MLNQETVTATIAVKDLEKARPFYEDRLGLKLVDTDGENYIAFKSGGSQLFVYQSAFAGGYKATVATWSVENLESIVEELKHKGVKFERYDMPGAEHHGDIHVMGPMKNAWCKDGDGNILSFVEG